MHTFAAMTKGFGKRVGGNVCHNPSSASMESIVRVEAPCLHMVVIVGFAAEAREEWKERTQTYKHIFVILRSVYAVIRENLIQSLTGSKVLLMAGYHTRFLKV